MVKGKVESARFRGYQAHYWPREAILLQPLNTAIHTDSVLEMNNEISFHDFGEVDRRSSASEPRPPKCEAASARALVTTKDFRIAQNRQFRFRINKTASQRSEDEPDCINADLVVAEHISQTLDFSLVMTDRE